MQLVSIPQRLRFISDRPGVRQRKDSLFYEEQPLRSAYVMVPLAVASVALLTLVIWQVLSPNAPKSPIWKEAAVAWTALVWIAFARVATVRIVTEVRPGELSVSAAGLWKSCRIPISSIRTAHVVSLDPVREYGGYGVRATRCGRAFTVGGDRGVRIELADGPAIVIGSRHPQQLAQALCDQLPLG